MEPVPERRVVMLTPNRTAARRLHRLDHHPVLSLDDIEQFLDEPLLFLEFGVREGFRRLEPQVPVFRLAGTRRKRDVDIGIESREVAPFGLHRNVVTSRRQADRIVGLARVAPRMGKATRALSIVSSNRDFPSAPARGTSREFRWSSCVKPSWRRLIDAFSW